jgi:polyphosphate kinase
MQASRSAHTVRLHLPFPQKRRTSTPTEFTHPTRRASRGKAAVRSDRLRAAAKRRRYDNCVKAKVRGKSTATGKLSTSAEARLLQPTCDSRFFNRELSLLDYSARILGLAEDNARPVLERVKFLAIFSSNLHERLLELAEARVLGGD